MTTSPFDSADEYELRKIFYRTNYYESPCGETESIRSGWSTAMSQFTAYATFLPFIERDGNVLDLGCGDGRLLAFLQERAPAKIVPYGVDFLQESIEIARTSVLPEYASCLFVANVANFEPAAARFAHVIVNPFYVTDRERGTFLRRCLNWVERGGSLLAYEYAGASGFEKLFDVCQRAGLPSCTLCQNAQVALVHSPR